MATQSTPQQFTDSQLFTSMSEVYALAATMVRALATRRFGDGAVITEVNAFQIAWNRNLPQIQAWAAGPADLTFSGVSAEVVGVGLSTDGKYGLRTAYALAILLAATDAPERTIQSLPKVPSGMPVWYAANSTVVEGVLMHNVWLVDPAQVNPEDATTVVVPDPSQSAPNQSTANQNVPSTAPGTIDTTGNEISFSENEGSTIASTAKRTGWNVPIFAVGLGLTTAGFLVYAVARRSKKKARIAL